VIEAEAGMGKSALLAAWMADVSAAALVVAARCDEVGRDLPLQPVINGLASYLASLGRDTGTALLGSEAPILELLLGRGTEIGAPSPVTTVGDAAMGRAAVFGALATVLARAAGHRPLVLVVDDLHSAATGTVDFLAFALRRLPRVMVVAACRPEPDADLPGAERIRLEPLTFGDAVALVGSDLAAALHERSGGHPLILRELAAHGEGPLPASIVDAVSAQLRGLDGAAASVEAAALCGIELDVELVAALAGKPVRAVLDDLERVSRGDVLTRLDDSIQRADVDRARANLTLSKSKHERSLDLRNKGFISGQALDESENNLRVAEADAQLMQARLSKMEIRAPFSGTIGLRQVSVGDYVKEGQDMVNLESLDPLKVDFRVPELAHSHVRDGQPLQLTLDAIPDKTYEGKVYAINPLIDANGRAIVIRAQVPNRDGRLRPGMFARVRLFISGTKDALVVPEEALFPLGDDKFVYKVVQGKAQRQKIEIGQRREGRVEVVNGLAPEDVVVTAGVIKLREGVPVTMANVPSPPPPVGRSDGETKPKG